MAKQIGGLLAISLAINPTATGGVDEWILQHKALQELDMDRKFCWFRPMMNTIALRLIGDVGWGLKLRVFVGAALSVLDLTTDIFITYTFLQEGKEMFFRSSVAMLGSSMFFMLLTVCQFF